MSFGTELRKVREGKGLGLREAARRMRISPQFLSDIELGHRLPGDGTYAAMVDLLGIEFTPERPTCPTCNQPLRGAL